MRLEKIKSRQIELNERLAEILINDQITQLKMTSVGNSIGSGYSMVRSIKPLLLRNETIASIMKDHGIDLVRKHFARAQNNNDEHVASWVIRNIKESEIHKMNRVDYGDSFAKMPGKINGLSDTLMDEYYPIDMADDRGLSDVILEQDYNLANIVIYNGCTGSFLDNVTRNGNFSQKFTYGVKRDLTGIRSTLNYIQTNNRYSNTNTNTNTNTQVYICGVPNFWGLGVSNIINNKLEKVAADYANVTYVRPVNAKVLYRTYDKKFPWIMPDFHYDEAEYLKLNNNIVESIINNYAFNKYMINIDRNFFQISSDLELIKQQLLGNNLYIQQVIRDVFIDQCDKFSSDSEKKVFRHKAKVYLKERAPYDFYYIGKKNIDSSL